MLIDFTVENFKSIREEQTLSMLVSLSKKEHPNNFYETQEKEINLLKTALIYGANASGKSNLLLAIQALKNLVVESTDHKLGEHITQYKPYKLDKKYSEEPSKFEIEFIADDKIRYRYIVKFNFEEILYEELLFYPNTQEALLFLREKGKNIKFGSHLRGKKKNIEAELIPNVLFLSKAANSNHEQLKVVYLFFRNSLTFLYDEFSIRNVNLSKRLAFLKGEDNTLTKLLSNFLEAADTGIHSVGMEIRSIDDKNQKKMLETFPEEIPKSDREKLLQFLSVRPVTYHKLFEGETEIGTMTFDLAEESNGTKRMYDIAPDIITGLKNGETIIIDELDSSLHPFLSEYIIELFSNPETNPNNAQIIATTHDVTLLNPKILRRDQIWFTSKNKWGATDVFSLDEFDKNEVRKSTPFDKLYLEGRFGAIPLINRKLFHLDHLDKSDKTEKQK